MHHIASRYLSSVFLIFVVGCGDTDTTLPAGNAPDSLGGDTLGALDDAMSMADTTRGSISDSGSRAAGPSDDDALASGDDTTAEDGDSGGRGVDATAGGEPAEVDTTDTAQQPETAIDDTTEPALPGDDAEAQQAQLPALPMGPADPTAATACALVDAPAVAVSSTAALNEAGQVLLDPSSTHGYLVTLPSSGEGYVTLQVPDWMAVVAGYVDYGTSLEILDPNYDTQEALPLSWNGACSDVGMTDQRLLYHAWGSFAVRVIGEPNADVHVSFIKVQ